MTSLAGLTFNYNTLDNTKDPRNGAYAELKTDVAGLGGDSRFFRATGDARYYYEIFEDIVGIGRAQAGHIVGFGDDDLRIVDHFFMGPSLVAALRPRASVRATFRASTADPTPSAARPMSACPPRSSSRSSDCRASSA